MATTNIRILLEIFISALMLSSWSTEKGIQILIQNIRYYCPILIQSGKRQIF